MTYRPRSASQRTTVPKGWAARSARPRNAARHTTRSVMRTACQQGLADEVTRVDSAAGEGVRGEGAERVDQGDDDRAQGHEHQGVLEGRRRMFHGSAVPRAQGRA